MKVPPGATRVDLAGKTVIPAILDSHVHLSTTREGLVDDLQRRAYYGVGAAMSLGQDAGDLPFQIRAETIPNGARFFTAGRGITMPEPGRNTVPYWIQTPDEGRKAVQELAARKVDIVKVWVDDRDGKYPKLGPALYGPIIAEAHRLGLRVTAHIFDLDDAKGLLKAGIDAFAHGVRDTDVDDELIAMLKQRPNFIVVPNLVDRGVKVDMSWLSGSMPAGELAETSGGGHRSARRAKDVCAAGEQPGADGQGRRPHRNGDRRQHAVGPAHRGGGHGRRRHDAGAGARRLRAQRGRHDWPEGRRHHRRRARAPTSSSSMRIRSTTSRIRGGFRRSISGAQPLIAQRWRLSGCRLSKTLARRATETRRHDCR